MLTRRGAICGDKAPHCIAGILHNPQGWAATDLSYFIKMFQLVADDLSELPDRHAAFPPFYDKAFPDGLKPDYTRGSILLGPTQWLPDHSKPY